MHIYYSNEQHNNMSTASMTIPQIYPGELFLKDNRAKHWFETFLRYTDEKEITSKIYYNIVKYLVDHERLNENTAILDVGCGDGILSLAISNGFKSKTSTIKYSCLEYDIERVNSFNELLTSNNINAHAIQGSCFGQDLAKMPYNVDLIVGSHIAYYAKDMGDFIDSLIDHAHKNSLIFLNHESSNSVTNQIRENYGSTINNKVAKMIQEYAINHPSIKLHEATMEAKILFPGNIYKVLDDIMQNPNLMMQGAWMHEDIFYDCCIHDQNLYDIKSLLEFVVQRPLETLSDEGKLIGYLAEVKSLLLENGNALPVASVIQLIPFKDSDYGDQVIIDALLNANNDF